jgi:hypothetical protein
LWLASSRPLWAQDASGNESSLPVADNGPHFESQIAPLFARHCLECHDAASKQGGLNLSQREAALAGGDSGHVIVAGDAAESLLWQYVDNDQMPKDRPALSPADKVLLRKWIDDGAIWTGDAIDAARHAPDRRAYHGARRLTVPEYIQTVRSAVGVDIERDARRFLPPDVRTDGFSNTAYNQNVDLEHVQAYAELAEIIVGRMDVAAFARKYTKNARLTDRNMRRLISRMGKWLLRGPLEDQEVEAFLRASSTMATKEGGFEEAASCIIEAMLQSPRFVYRIETQPDDPERPAQYELASRLSYVLWGGPPDAELMDAADAGVLSDRDAVKLQVARMLTDPRAVERSCWFLHEWLNLEQLNNLKPNADRFPQWDARLADDMRAETLEFFKDVAWQRKRPLSELLNSQVTFLTPRLAAHYGHDADGPAVESSGPDFTSVPARVADGVVALFTFQEGSGDLVRDVSGCGKPIVLKIADPAAVRWSEQGLAVESPTLIASDDAKRLARALKKSSALTLEAWITPFDQKQAGPARILSLSAGPTQRNFTLGQDGDRFDVRLRATSTDGNGLPSLASSDGAVELKPTHVVFTRDRSGLTTLYINGEQNAVGDVGGDFSNWDDGFSLVVANESTNDRPWRGTLHRLAVYNRALTSEEIQSNARLPARYDLSKEPNRGGLLTQGSLLTVGGDDASMVTRGLFILQDLLYSRVGDPPACVDTTPVPTKPGLSQRAIAEARLADKSCAGCHSKFEPLAFGLEIFDGLGTFHEKDQHGNELRDDGEIHIPGDDKPVSYESCAELMDLLAASDRVKRNITRKITQFAIGRPLVAADETLIEKIHAAAQEGGGTYESVITAVVMSDLVQMAPTENKQ